MNPLAIVAIGIGVLLLLKDSKKGNRNEPMENSISGSNGCGLVGQPYPNCEQADRKHYVKPEEKMVVEPTEKPSEKV